MAVIMGLIDKYLLFLSGVCVEKLNSATDDYVFKS